MRILLPLLLAAQSFAQVQSFSTGGHTVYHLRPATTAKGVRAVVSAAFDGTVLCHTPQGRLLWKAQTGGHIPFDLAAADIDGDGLDEALVASADGALYALDNDGRLLWKFARTAPLFQVTVARLASGDAVILTGGVEQVLYSLSPDGRLLGKLETEHCIRHLRAGRILTGEQDHAAIATSSAGLSGLLSLLLVEPGSLKTVWSRRNLATHAANSGRRFFSMAILDLNKDGREDILLSNSWGENGKLYAFDHNGKELFTASDKRIPNVSYRMNLLSRVNLPDDEYVLGLFANILIVYNLDGTLRTLLTCRQDFAGGAFDAESRTYYLGSSVSGGDGIHALRLDQSGWQDAFEKIQPVGKLARIEANLAELERRIAAFRPPPYQPEPSPATVLARKPDGAQYTHLRFVEQLTLSQKFDAPCREVWCRDTDSRQRYQLSADEIVNIARERETQGIDFLIWSGHGHAAYMPLSTMDRVLQAAPEHFYGFVFAEMEGVDDEMRQVVGEIIKPLAELCRRHGGKKIVFRNKNIFYNGTAYVPFWRGVLMDPDLRGVFVPALEETNSRTAELSLAGRIGLWLTGGFDGWACRAVTDNACFDRMWEWSSQQSQGHHVRHLVSSAALGASVFFNNIHQGPFSRELEGRLKPFYDMVEKGILHIPSRDELLSVSPVALGMQSPPAPLYLKHGINGHQYRYPQDDHSPLVFDRLDTYWGGAPLLAHDFSRYAFNLRSRITNFLPETPFGMVAMIPAGTPLEGSRFDRVFATDGQSFFDEEGTARGAAESRAGIEEALRRGAAALPVLVEGPAHWSAVRLDRNHIRVTLVDPGYLDPDDRDAVIVLQRLSAVAAADILSGENLALAGARVQLRIPAGSVRIVDITHE